MGTETIIPPLRSSMHALLSVKNVILLDTKTNAFDGKITRLLLMSVKKINPLMGTEADCLLLVQG
mgnify:CR=1 FL=1